ncbi:MAG: tRNA pseudouridine(55) synthase TruB [Spirochaetes bacterium]|nr:tRNA pseudouridine(55) synthase TruB [Spirochaetota bacterium]
MRASGFLLYDKPAGPTSFQALGAFRKVFPGIKVGHSGTLDSFATGLLVLVAGSYSRLTPWFVGLDKRYQAELSFGSETDTLDPQGEVIAEGLLPSLAAIEAVLPGFTGPIMQIPPRYSAIHVGGARASDLAVRGRDFELAARAVSIYSLSLNSFENGKAILSVHCSSGTYIRSLARDLARSLGTFAHLSALRRLSVGPFDIADAENTISAATSFRAFDPETARKIGLSVGYLGEGFEADFSNGKASAFSRLKVDGIGEGRDCAVFSAAGDLLGLVSLEAARPVYKVVLSEVGGSR